jgi:hypothetical protein
VKNLAVVESATDADSEGPVRKKRKRTKDNHGLGMPIEICKVLNYGSSYFVNQKHVKEYLLGFILYGANF